MEPKRPDIIPGYDHPGSMVYSKDRRYKTFTEGKKPKKIEKFGTVSTGNNYLSINNLEDPNDENETCPVCAGKSLAVCPCVYNDRKCLQGHIWYVNRNDGKIKLGNPHKK